MMLESCGTVLETEKVAETGAVRVRYVAPVVSDWLRDAIPLAALLENGWRVIDVCEV